MNTTIYYGPEAKGSNAHYFFDGIYMYERIHGLGSLGALHGWLRRIGKKLKKGIKKVAKKTWKGVKKVGKVAVKVLKKVLPIAQTVLAFVPGVGWAASAALMAAEVGIKAADKAIERNKRRKLMKALNRKKTTPVKPVKPVKPIQAVNKNGSVLRKSEPLKTKSLQATPIRRPKVYTAADFVKINEAITRNQIQPDQVMNLVNQVNNQQLQTVLNF